MAFFLSRSLHRRRSTRSAAEIINPVLLATAALVLLLTADGWFAPPLSAAPPAGTGSAAESTAGATAPGQDQLEPTALTLTVRPTFTVERFSAGTVDREAVRIQDEERDRQGLPPRYAIPQAVSMTPATAGTWEEVGAGLRLWRLRITSPGALSLNLGFSRYHLPPGAHLFIYDTKLEQRPLHFTDRDNEDHGQLWTPVVIADDIMVELTVPAKLGELVELELASVNAGYRFFGEDLGETLGAEFSDKAGSCNIDVVCPQGDGWREEIPSVGLISISGYLKCTGFMVNNTAYDQTPYFMTANHCGLVSIVAASLVVYWNFQSPTCGAHGGGSYDQFQTGSTFRSSYNGSDFTLVVLDDDPNPDWGVTYAGWNRADVDPTSAVTIHHPTTDEKSISFDYDPSVTTTYLMNDSPGDGTHLRIIDWDLGTTEPGSSGSPLFDQNHRVVGQLHGGWAACGNDLSDWYGRFFVSWTGNGTPATRLSDWLDPLGSGEMAVDVLVPGATGMRLIPAGGLSASGDVGGPFAPDNVIYTVRNNGTSPIDYIVNAQAGWLSLVNASGQVAAGGSAEVIIQFNANAADLPVGKYTDTVSFVNLSSHEGDTSRPVSLRVGSPELIYSFNLDSDPGWRVKGSWAFGQPAGGGGEYGNPDPTSGFTGANVYGYNLYGDYKNGIPEEHLTSMPLDCRNLNFVTLKFQRWLGVESSLFDRAAVQVSNDGIDYVTVWQNGVEIADAEWVEQEFDISQIADNQPTVYLRWTMGPTDESWRYCGWNIDDIQIWALDRSATGIADHITPARTALLPNRPNPFNPVTEILFELARPGQVRLEIYDMRGRLIRVLVDETRLAGRHSEIWDGADRTGRPVGSGSYLALLKADGQRVERKMMLVR
jgi:hypothetical protein